TRNAFALKQYKSNHREAEDDVATLEHIPDLLLDLESAESTNAERPTRALRLLFALSEHANNGDGNIIGGGEYHQNRIQMLLQPEEQRSLVPVLLMFLERCGTGSQEQHMTLLVLNNISIPLENKRAIALDHGGAKVLAKLLCEDPSCHLLAIVLVNLSFSDMNLRRQLLNSGDSETSSIALVESLAFALRVASLTKEEYHARIATIEECCSNTNDEHTAADRLSILMAEDQRLRQEKQQQRHHSKILPMISSSLQLYPETTRWCLSALRNLTRPCKNANAAHVLIQSSAYALILQFISIVDQHGSFVNEPHTWDSDSLQDTALSIVMNLSACSFSREYMNEAQTIKVLSTITNYPESAGLMDHLDDAQRNQMKLQCLKAT
ncbi:MAG: hypothetical protein SGILL_001594, partial [Bacillariaceae sp.]